MSAPTDNTSRSDIEKSLVELYDRFKMENKSSRREALEREMDKLLEEWSKLKNQQHAT